MTAKYDATFTWPSAAPHSVIVTGTFDAWSGNTHHLAKVGDGFEGSVALDWGQTYEYKYVVDGTWQARDDQDKEWDSQGNMNNVVRAPPAPAHAADAPAPTATDAPAADLPNATVIAPTAGAGAKAADDVLVPKGSGAGEEALARKEDVAKAIDEAAPAPKVDLPNATVLAPATGSAPAAPEGADVAARKEEVAQAIDEAAPATTTTATPSLNETVAPHTVDSDLSSTRSVRAADGLAIEPTPVAAAATAAAAAAAVAAHGQGEPTDAQKIARGTAGVPSAPLPIPAAASASAGETATTPKPLVKALAPLTADADDGPTAAETIQSQLTELSTEAQQLAAQGLDEARHLATQASAGVAGLVAGVEGLVFGKAEAFGDGQAKGLQAVDGANLSENGTSATDFSLVDDASQASQASDFHHVATPPKLEADEPVVVPSPAPGSAGPASASAIAPALDFATLPGGAGSLASTLTSPGFADKPKTAVTDQAKVDRDAAPAVEAAKQDLAAGNGSLASSQISSAPTASTSTPTAPSASTAAAPAAAAVAPAVPTKDTPVSTPSPTTVPGGYPSALSASSPVDKTKAAAGADDKVRKRKSGLLGKVSRIFSGSKDKAAK